METYTELKAFVTHPEFLHQKQKALAGLSDDMIDQPIIGLVNGLNRLPHCFTLQSCYGHFVSDDLPDQYNLEPLPVDREIKGDIAYRNAYIAFCLENTVPGKKLFELLKTMTAIDPRYLQFCCAQWFWERQVNSYVLQVAPDRFKDRDTAVVDFKEALHIEQIRNVFFRKLNVLLQEITT